MTIKLFFHESSQQTIKFYRVAKFKAQNHVKKITNEIKTKLRRQTNDVVQFSKQNYGAVKFKRVSKLCPNGKRDRLSSFE